MNYLEWAKRQQSQSPVGNNLSGYESLSDYSSNPAPEMMGTASPIDWTQNASSQLGTGGFTGAGLTPQTSLWGKMGTSDFWMGGKNKDTGMQSNGAAGLALGAASGLFNGYMAMKQYGLSKDIFNNSKEQFAKNFGAQKGLTNGSLVDRQDQRVRESVANGRPGAVMSTADYMSKYGVA